jgi:hypothetical protein
LMGWKLFYDTKVRYKNANKNAVSYSQQAVK